MDCEWMAEQYMLGRSAFSFKCTCGHISTIPKHAVIHEPYMCEECGLQFKLILCSDTKRQATLKPGWEMPEPPGTVCPRSGKPIHIPLAVLVSGEGWGMHFVCEDRCGYCIDAHGAIIEDWPFIERTATVFDMEALGFEVEIG